MRLFLVLVMLLSAGGTARADIILTASDTTIGKAGAAGLSGTFYHEGSGTTGYNVDKTIALMQASKATGTFVSTAINYSGTDASTITSFLRNDQSSYKGSAAQSFDLSDAILHLTGYYYTAGPKVVTFGLSHDDSAQFSIGGKVALSTAFGNNSTTVNLTAPGYYAFDLVYSNTNYFNVGSAYLNLTANGQVVTSTDLVQSVVPEPGTLALVAVGLLIVAAASRRFRLRV